MDLVHILTPWFFNVHFNIILPSMPGSRRMRWVGHVAHMSEERGVYRVLAGRPEGKRLLGRLRRWWEDNIKTDFREMGIDGTNWIQLAQDGV
jgi:hypothetical protein